MKLLDTLLTQPDLKRKSIAVQGNWRDTMQKFDTADFSFDAYAIYITPDGRHSKLEYAHRLVAFTPKDTPLKTVRNTNAVSNTHFAQAIIDKILYQDFTNTKKALINMPEITVDEWQAFYDSLKR